MILSEDRNDAFYQIQAYNKDFITVNNQIYTQSLIITPYQLHLEWPPKNVQMITDQDLLLFITFEPEIILLGTGKHGVILAPHRLAILLNKQYAVECMSTEAACRTYAALSAEGRQVVAGLIIEP